MGGGVSGLYSETLGSNREHSKPAPNSREALTESALSWAKREEKRLGEISKSKRKDFNTACVVYDEATGKSYFGRNKGISQERPPLNPKLFGEDGVLPKESKNNYALGNCAEVHAVNNALNAGAKLENLTMMTIKYEPRTGQIGTPKRACKNCTLAFEHAIKKNHSGWTEV